MEEVDKLFPVQHLTWPRDPQHAALAPLALLQRSRPVPVPVDAHLLPEDEEAVPLLEGDEARSGGPRRERYLRGAGVELPGHGRVEVEGEDGAEAEVRVDLSEACGGGDAGKVEAAVLLVGDLEVAVSYLALVVGVDPGMGRERLWVGEASLLCS